MPFRLAGHLALLIVVPACQGAPDGVVFPIGSEGVRAGTRLRPVFLSDGEGARAFVGFYDTERAEDCIFHWDMGTRETRCVPDFGLPRSCLGTTSWPHAGQPDVVEEYGERYVAGQVVDQGAGRVRERAIVGEDGSRQAIWIDDHELGALCDSIAFGDDPKPCVPVALLDIGVTGESVYADAACRERLFGVHPDCASRAPTYEVVFQTAIEPWGIASILRRGQAVSPSIGYILRDGSCSATALDTPYVQFGWFTAGSEIGPDQLASGRRVRAGSGGRLEPYDSVVGNLRTRLGQDAFHDRELDVDCVPAVATDGAVRCIPVPEVSQFFLDNECTKGAGLVASSGAPPPVASRSIAVDGRSQRQHEVRLVGAELSPDVDVFFHPYESFTCVAADAADRHYQPAGVVPPDELVLLERVVE